MDDQMIRDRIRGSLFGGAIGDALGYPVEFMSKEGIKSQFGEGGIHYYVLDPRTGTANISDDTQMTLFTANGLLAGRTADIKQRVVSLPRSIVAEAYQDWLRTQNLNYREGQKWLADNKGKNRSWLCDVPELYHLRAPGNTCIISLEKQKNHPISGSYIEACQNNSKGCGGVMRIAPLGLLSYPYLTMEELDLEGAEIAAITHGHPLGYMPAAVLTHIIHKSVYNTEKDSLETIIRDAIDTAEKIFIKESYPDAHAKLRELKNILCEAIDLSKNNKRDIENISSLGGGWVGEQALGIAVYCALKYQDDFSSGVIASVNHGGDSDSTGAVTGNMLGAWVGYESIDEKWKKNLEISEVIQEMAEDIILCSQSTSATWINKDEWQRKYTSMRWKKSNQERKTCEEDPAKDNIDVKTFRLEPDTASDILTILTSTGIYSSRQQAEFGVQYGAVWINQRVFTDIQKIFSEEELKEGVLIRRGIGQPVLVIR